MPLHTTSLTCRRNPYQRDFPLSFHRDLRALNTMKVRCHTNTDIVWREGGLMGVQSGAEEVPQCSLKWEEIFLALSGA